MSVEKIISQKIIEQRADGSQIWEDTMENGDTTKVHTSKIPVYIPGQTKIIEEEALYVNENPRVIRRQ